MEGEGEGRSGEQGGVAGSQWAEGLLAPPRLRLSPVDPSCSCAPPSEDCAGRTRPLCWHCSGSSQRQSRQRFRSSARRRFRALFRTVSVRASSASRHR